MKSANLTRWSVWLGIVLAAVAAPSIARADWFGSGIRGQVLFQGAREFQFQTNAPILTPVIRIIPPPIPMSASFRVYAARTGRFITTVRTEAQGRFRVGLRAGVYRLVPDTIWHGRALKPGELVIGPYRAAAPLELRVRKNRFVAATVTYSEAMGF